MSGISVNKFILILAVFSCAFCQNTFAAEMLYSVQHLKLKKFNFTGWEHDVFAKTNLSQNLIAGLEGSYVERFSLYETTYGGLMGYKFTDKFYVEAHYNQGIGNKLLTERQTQIISYYSLFPGVAPFIILKDKRYSDTKLLDFTLGAEIEKWPHILIIPQAMIGKSKFKSDNSQETIYSYSLKAIYYTEDKFSIFAYGSRGLESAQSITGASLSNQRIHTLTGGAGGSYNIFKNLKAEISVDHTDYHEIKDQFITSTFSLNLKF